MRAVAKLGYALVTAVVILAIMSPPAMAETIASGPLQLGTAAYQRHDYAIALLLLRPLAEQGVAGAQLVLGFMYHDGEGVPQDYAQAAQWMRKAAEQGDESAEASLGGMYLAGQGVPKSDDDAALWLQKAADQGMAPAQFALGGLDDLHGKTAEALKWYRLAAAQG
ncbi:MAG: tetratricopeptide repeat protein, partial [Xanthobacteraceae bacterium]